MWRFVDLDKQIESIRRSNYMQFRLASVRFQILFANIDENIRQGAAEVCRLLARNENHSEMLKSLNNIRYPSQINK